MFSVFKKRPILAEDLQEKVVAAIRAAEARTTGEIRVFVERHCVYMDPILRAKEIFVKLEMTKTERRNAVLIYIATIDRQFALLGDQEIYHLAGRPEFWSAAAGVLKSFLKEDKIADGLVACIQALSDALATHFPNDPSIAKNQLPDEIVFGK